MGDDGRRTATNPRLTWATEEDSVPKLNEGRCSSLASQETMLAAKPKGLSSISGTHEMEGGLVPTSLLNLYMCDMMCIPTVNQLV